MEPIRIVLVDDHWLMRDEMRRILEQSPEMDVVAEAEDGQQALEMVGRVRPDVVILDIRMPKLNGIEVIRQIKVSSPGTRALILTAFDEEEYILAAMKAGASGYLLKTVKADELLLAIKKVRAGEPVLHPAIATKVARLWARNQSLTNTDPPEPLSQRELQVIRLAAKGLKTKAIAQELHISDRTVEGYFNSIHSKIGVSSRLEAVLYAISQHLINLDDGDSA